MSKDWRIETNAVDYLTHQKKQTDLDNRRPVVRKAADLVGPGIDAGAVTLTDYNDVLAMFNGYFSSDIGALNAPNSTDPFIGFVVADDALGGEQVFRSLVSGNQYVRVFLRNPADPTAVTWQEWETPDSTPASVISVHASGDTNLAATELPSGAVTDVVFPRMQIIGASGMFAVATKALHILQPGVYSGYAWFSSVDSPGDDNFVTVNIDYPQGDQVASDQIVSTWGPTGVMMPVHFWASAPGSIRVRAVQAVISSMTFQFRRLHLSRIGEG